MRRQPSSSPRQHRLRRRTDARRTIRRLAAVLAVLAGATGLYATMALTPATSAFADGPAPCTVGGPPFPFAGFCATYSGDNTWYGSYGPGFPTDEGWGFCADPPASGGDYPAPVYDYAASGAPAGANTFQAGALGFAFSEAQALAWWGGSPGLFTSDQAAVAGKLLYDAVVWASPVPAMDPGVLAAYQALDSWYVQAVGATGDPQVTSGLVGGASTFAGQAVFQVQAIFPGTNNTVTGLPIELSITGGTLNTTTGPTSLTLATDATGTATFPIFASTPGPVTVSLSVPGGLGHAGLDFYSPTALELGAQGLAAFSAPVSLTVSQQLTALPTTGTLSVVKSGDDTAYYPLTGAVFQVLSGSAVVATLTTAADGTTVDSPPLPAGPYTVHETAAPAGYATAPDETTTVVAGSNTVVSFTGASGDHVIPATLTIAKTDAETAAPLAGAVFDISYDSGNDGTFDENAGTCTTGTGGSCSPKGNDGSGQLLPGRYQITETATPPGYALSNPATQTVDLLAAENGSVSFGDPKLVSAVFEKTATGNINPAQLTLAGAVIDVELGPAPGGPIATECTTNSSGTCTTAPVLVSGDHYCWIEGSAPPGLAGGANGCFTASNELKNQPIAVQDPGKFVGIAVKKVDAANPAVGLPGATFGLYRENAAAYDLASQLPINETLVATTTTGNDGIGTFPLQLPGYEYCIQELGAPPNYVVDTARQCTGVLAGTTAVPAPITTLTFADTEATITLSVFKYNSLSPGTGIPGAVYDLYVQGAAPPSGVPGVPPTGVVPEPGDTWYERGTTGPDGRLKFTVPAGYGWCVLEVSAPVDYVLDTALRCSAVLTTSSEPSAATIAVPETLATVHISAFKYNSHRPNTVIPGASYELVANSANPPGAPTAAPPGVDTPAGDAFWAEGTTDANGVLTFAVPAGYSWCLHELVAPAAYAPDPAFHCTAVLTTDTTGAAATVAVPETPLTGNLPFTGFPALWLGLIGGALVLVGGVTVAVDLVRRRRAD